MPVGYLPVSFRVKLGVASGILATTRNLGLATSVAFSGTLRTARMLSHRAAGVPTGTPGDAAFTAAVHEVYVVAIGSGVVAFAP